MEKSEVERLTRLRKKEEKRREFAKQITLSTGTELGCKFGDQELRVAKSTTKCRRWSCNAR